MVNECLLVHIEKMGHRVNSYLEALLSFSHHNQPIFFADMSGDSYILGTGSFFKIKIQLIYNVVLVSGVQKSDSIYIYF